MNPKAFAGAAPMQRGIDRPGAAPVDILSIIRAWSS